MGGIVIGIWEKSKRCQKRDFHSGGALKAPPPSFRVKCFLMTHLLKSFLILFDRKGYYYLFYSSGWYSKPFYNVRVAKSKSPTGPFIKKKFPILETNWIPYNKNINTTFVGPGHNECSKSKTIAPSPKITIEH